MRVFYDTKIYVCCPAYAHSGGPEALHVLAHDLREMGLDAKMLYYDVRKDVPDLVAERFKRFKVPYVTEKDDRPHNIVVIPEMEPARLRDFPLSQRAFWWLSVDFYTLPWQWKGWMHLLWWLKERTKRAVNFVADPEITHLCQSYYAMDYVTRRGFKNRFFLMDYLGREFVEASVDFTSERENVVLYNPMKGIDFTRKLISASPDIRFVPLRGMSPVQVRDTCLKSKVYIDFGEHPGKDRFPRETAMLGNVIITNRRGSAGFHADVPIPDEYKFAGVDDDIPAIRNLIQKSFMDYAQRVHDFDAYRDFIREDRTRFVSQIKKVFVRG